MVKHFEFSPKLRVVCNSDSSSVWISNENLSKVKDIHRLDFYLWYFAFCSDWQRKHILSYSFNINHHNHFILFGWKWNKLHFNVCALFFLDDISLWLYFEFFHIEFSVSWDSQTKSKWNKSDSFVISNFTRVCLTSFSYYFSFVKIHQYIFIYTIQTIFIYSPLFLNFKKKIYIKNTCTNSLYLSFVYSVLTSTSLTST